MNVEILFIAILTSLSTSLVGVFLVLRRLSMLTDAISHTVLLGIVLSFMITLDLNSPLLFVGATMSGVVTVYLIEALIKTKRVKEDASIGVVFTLLFAIAVIIINTRFRNVHLDIDMVLLGNLEFAIFERVTFLGISMPTSLVVMALVLLLNSVFIAVFYKEIKLTSFDAALASVLGLMPSLIHYAMMTLVSLTAVAAFNAVGAILVIALMIGPPITARFFTKTLFATIVLTLAIATVNSILGTLLARVFDVTISGTIASTSLAVFLLVLLFAPKGIIGALIQTAKKRRQIMIASLLVHIQNHEKTAESKDELAYDSVHKHLKWKRQTFEKIYLLAKRKKFVAVHNDLLSLQDEGRSVVQTFYWMEEA